MTQTNDNEHKQDFHVMCACLPSSLDDVHNNMAVMESAFPKRKKAKQIYSCSAKRFSKDLKR